MSPSSNPAPAPKRLGRAILSAGLLAGTLDIGAALGTYWFTSGKNPLNVLPYVASGLFGKAAFGGGPGMKAWGLGLHYGIALTFTALFFGVAARLPWLRRHWVAGGLLYGVVVWLVMNLLVVPASQAPPLPFAVGKAAVGMFTLLLCIGLPVAWRAARFYAPPPPRQG